MTRLSSRRQRDVKSPESKKTSDHAGRSRKANPWLPWVLAGAALFGGVACGRYTTPYNAPQEPDAGVPTADMVSPSSYCPEDGKVVVGSGGPEPTNVMTLQIGDKIDINDNQYAEFMGVNQKGQAVFYIKDKNSDKLLGLVTLAPGEQTTITNSEGEEIILEACTIGGEAVTVASDQPLERYVPKEPKSKPPEVESCEPEPWCTWHEPITGQLNVGGVLEFPDCYSIVLEDVESSSDGNRVSVAFVDPNGQLLHRFILDPAEETPGPGPNDPSITIVDENTGRSYHLWVNEIFSGDTFGATWANITAKPADNASECFAQVCESASPTPTGAIISTISTNGQPLSISGDFVGAPDTDCVSLVLLDVWSEEGVSHTVFSFVDDTGEALSMFQLQEGSHTANGRTGLRVDCISAAPGYTFDARWADVVVSRNTDTLPCDDPPGAKQVMAGPLTLNTEWFDLGTDRLRAVDLVRDSFGAVDSILFRFDDSGVEFTVPLNSSTVIGNGPQYHEVAVCGINEDLSTVDVAIYAAR